MNGMKTKESSIKLEAYRLGIDDGFYCKHPDEYCSHHYTRSYNKGYKEGTSLYKKGLK